MPHRRKIRKSFDLFSAYDWYAPDIKGVIILLLMFLVGIVLANILVLVLAVAGGDLLSAYSDVIAYPVMFIPAMIYAGNKSRFNALWEKPVRMDGNNAGRLGWWLLVPMVIVTTIAANIMSDPLQFLLPEAPQWFMDMMEKMMVGRPLWVTLLSVSVFAPIFEEWLCRGMILRGLLRTMHPIWAMMISSMIFAIIHLNPWQALPAFVLGMLFAYVYYRTGSLKLTMLMHCANNTFSALLGQNERLREMTSWLDLMSGWQYAALIVAAVFIVAVFIDILRRNVPLVQADVPASSEE